MVIEVGDTLIYFIQFMTAFLVTWALNSKHSIKKNQLLFACSDKMCTKYAFLAVHHDGKQTLLTWNFDMASYDIQLYCTPCL